MAFKFYTSVAKGAKPKVKMILEIIRRFAGIPMFPRFDVTGARGRRGGGGRASCLICPHPE